MLGKASVIKIRNQVKDIPVHQERVFSFVAILLFSATKIQKRRLLKILQAIFNIIRA
jgi:hypothetical protein